MTTLTTSILALTITGWALTLTAAAQEPEEHDLRAELESRLDGVEARIAAIPARDCAPGSRHDALLAMIEDDIERSSPLSPEEASRIAEGIRSLDAYAGYYASAAAFTCADHDKARSNLDSLEELRDRARERLMDAVIAIQSDLPASPAELKDVFRAPNCYYPSRHTVTTSICLFEGTPFEAMRRFILVDDDGVIRARGGMRLGRDVMTQFFRKDGSTVLYRDHSNATLRNSVEGLVFGSMAMRKTLRWNRQNMRDSIMGTLYGRVRRLSHLDALPRSADMRSTENGNSSDKSPVTVAGVYVARLVNAARSHAAATCAATVRNGARLARAFTAGTPEGEAARIYVDAERLIRAEIEQIAATGADELCDRRQTDMRALVDPVLARVVNPPGDVEMQLYEQARLDEELKLRVLADRLRERYFFGSDVPLGLGADVPIGPDATR